MDDDDEEEEEEEEDYDDDGGNDDDDKVKIIEVKNRKRIRDKNTQLKISPGKTTTKKIKTTQYQTSKNKTPTFIRMEYNGAPKIIQVIVAFSQSQFPIHYPLIKHILNLHVIAFVGN